MKNARFEYLIEKLAAEGLKHDYDSAFSDLMKIDSMAHKRANGYGVSVKTIYEAIDVDPIMFFKEISYYPEDSDFHYSDVMRDLMLLENALVPEEHKKYGGLGKIMPEFLKNDDAIFNFFGGGEPVKRKEVVLNEEIDMFNHIIGGIIKHKKAVIGGAALFLGLYLAGNALVNASKEEHGDATDRGIRQAELGISGAGAGLEGLNLLNDGNASAVTATPTFDYYDEEFKVGINIQDGIEGNVTNILKTLKDRAPKRYAEVIPYAPKVIVSTTGNNYYWDGDGFRKDDEIALNQAVINGGGMMDDPHQLGTAENLYGELIAAKISKNGEIKLLKDNYEAELYIHSSRAKIRVEFGLWTPEYANAWLERGGWFEAITGRRPTAEDMEGVDINKYLIK